jgi:cobalamin biosynthetic protein CobC
MSAEGTARPDPPPLDPPVRLTEPARRDHGGGIDAAIAAWGGRREDWLDLSTGINPVPYPIPPIPDHAWTALPDRAAQDDLLAAARAFWRVPSEADIIAAPGLSALIACLPRVSRSARIAIPGPTYNEWAASYLASGSVVDKRGPGPASVLVHPNNPDGRLWSSEEVSRCLFAVIDESFCDVTPAASHVAETARHRCIVLKSFGKFWGLAGVRLGFAIRRHGPEADQLREALGPWSVSGPALAIGTAALTDLAWAEATRARLAHDAARLDAIMQGWGARVVGGTALFRLYDIPEDKGGAAAWHLRLAKGFVLSRIFPYSRTWLRLGLPAPDRWTQLEAALAATGTP